MTNFIQFVYHDRADNVIPLFMQRSVIKLDGHSIIDISLILECHFESQIKNARHQNVLSLYKIYLQCCI